MSWNWWGEEERKEEGGGGKKKSEHVALSVHWKARQMGHSRSGEHATHADLRWAGREREEPGMCSCIKSEEVLKGGWRCQNNPKARLKAPPLAKDKTIWAPKRKIKITPQIWKRIQELKVILKKSGVLYKQMPTNKCMRNDNQKNQHFATSSKINHAVGIINWC